MRSADGTRLQAWSSDGDGEPVLLCNGLGTPPGAWPRIVAPDSGYRVVSWYQRGLGGSERPADRARVRVEDHADDARAVLDAFGLRSATVVGWSLGVNVAFELANLFLVRNVGLKGFRVAASPLQLVFHSVQSLEVS